MKLGGIAIVEVPWKYSIYNSLFLRRLITGKKNPNDEPVNKVYDARELRKLFIKFRSLKIRSFLTLVLYGVFRK